MKRCVFLLCDQPCCSKQHFLASIQLLYIEFSFYLITFQIPEPFALEARYFVERRLLQREVRIIPETASTNNLVGSIIHPNGNIAELLLREGFARCVDWNMGNVTGA